MPHVAPAHPSRRLAQHRSALRRSGPVGRLRAVAAATAATVLATATVLVGGAAPAAAGDVQPPVLPIPAERDLAMLLDELGMPWGTVVNSWDVTDAADVLGVEVTVPPLVPGLARNFGLDPLEVWRKTLVRTAEPHLVQAFRERTVEVFDSLGVDYGASIDESDLLRLAEALGVPVGSRVDPADVSQLIDAGRRAARIATTQFAKVDGLRLHLPAHRVAGIGYHQAPRSGEHRLAMTNLDQRGFTMPSRGRGTHPTSAVDISMPVGVEVLAPVSGVVEDVTSYSLYGRYPDAHLSIRPDGHANRAVRVLHVRGLKVRPGQRVEGGITPIAASANPFPFESQIDGHVGRHPHVDISVRPR